MRGGRAGKTEVRGQKGVKVLTFCFEWYEAIKAFGMLRARINPQLRWCEQAGVVGGRSGRNMGTATVRAGAGVRL